jgi:hypothetical protein
LYICRYQLCWRPNISPSPGQITEIEKTTLEIEKALCGTTAPGDTSGSTGVSAVGQLDITLPDGSIPDWLWNGEKLSNLPGWKLIRQANTVGAVPSSILIKEKNADKSNASEQLTILVPPASPP